MNHDFYDAFQKIFNQASVRLQKLLTKKLEAIRMCKDDKNIVEYSAILNSPAKKAKFKRHNSTCTTHAYEKSFNKKQFHINYNTRFCKNSVPLQKLLKMDIEKLADQSPKSGEFEDA